MVGRTHRPAKKRAGRECPHRPTLYTQPKLSSKTTSLPFDLERGPQNTTLQKTRWATKGTAVAVDFIDNGRSVHEVVDIHLRRCFIATEAEDPPDARCQSGSSTRRSWCLGQTTESMNHPSADHRGSSWTEPTTGAHARRPSTFGSNR